ATAGSVTTSRTMAVGDELLATVRSHGDGRFTSPRLELVVFGSVDAVRGVRTLSFAGLDAAGNATLGTRVGP
ncbi:hypothetical protein, partial [Cellulomonas sp. P5_C6]